MTVSCHVCNGAHFNAWCIHRHNDFANARMWRSVAACAANEIAIIGIGTKAGPNLLTVDNPLIAIVFGKSFQRCEVASGIGFAHADAPRCFTGQDARQEFFLLFRSSVLDECWTHLTVTKPTSCNRSASFDHLFANNETFNRWSSTATKLSGPYEADPTVGGELTRELFRIPVHPRSGIASVSGDAIGGYGSCLLSKGNVFRAPLKIH